MVPLRLVFDTNEIVSAAIKPKGLQRTALTLALTFPARLYVSEPVLAEYEEVLVRPKFGLTKSARLGLLQELRKKCYAVRPKYRIEACVDPDDDIFLECADASRADYLVTGNVRHFPAFWKATKVITAREFVGLVSPHLLEKRR